MWRLRNLFMYEIYDERKLFKENYVLFLMYERKTGCVG